MKRASLRLATLLLGLAAALPGCALYEPDFGVSEKPYHSVSPEWRSREFHHRDAYTVPPTGRWDVR